MIPVTDLVTRPPLDNLFPWDDALLATITKSMVENGFDLAHPLVVWTDAPGGPTVIDGHHRLAAARAARLEEVPVARVYFSSEKEALERAIAEQRDRRNMSAEELRAHVARAIASLDKSKEERREAVGGSGANQHTRATGSPDPVPDSGRSADHIATVVGTSPATVKRVRAVLDSGDEETKKQLLDGKVTPKAAARKVSTKTQKNNGFRTTKRRAAEERLPHVVDMLETVADALGDQDIRASLAKADSKTQDRARAALKKINSRLAWANKPPIVEARLVQGGAA